MEEGGGEISEGIIPICGEKQRNSRCFDFSISRRGHARDFSQAHVQREAIF
jgi:tRNA(Ser,Leu) C12 N-acetylase TAN1